MAEAHRVSVLSGEVAAGDADADDDVGARLCHGRHGQRVEICKGVDEHVRVQGADGVRDGVDATQLRADVGAPNA